MKSSVGIGLLGLGNVGSNVYGLLTPGAGLSDTAGLPSATGANVVVQRVLVRHARKKRAVALPAGMLTLDPEDVLTDPTVQIVVELIGCPSGDKGPALDLIRRAIMAGKHVVTANKKLLAENGQELALLALDHGVSLRFEASISGAIPIVRALSDYLVASRVRSIDGVLNGTTNYILSQMSLGVSLNAALREAHRKGLAEADPSSDLSGSDATYKLCLLVALATGVRIRPSQVTTQGIQELQSSDIAYAQRLGYKVKLLASFSMDTYGCRLSVRPALMPETHFLAQVEGQANGLVVSTELAGDFAFAGQGAGGLPTASAVVADILDTAESLDSNPVSRAQLMLVNNATPLGAMAIPHDNLIVSRFYIRLRAMGGSAERTARALEQGGLVIEKYIGETGEARASTHPDFVAITARVPASDIYTALMNVGARFDQRSTVLIPVAAFGPGLNGPIVIPPTVCQAEAVK